MNRGLFKKIPDGFCKFCDFRRKRCNRKPCKNYRDFVKGKYK